MKCVILAGGSGDSLWPLSRKNYPKQFMKFKEGRSLLQETVVRNLPYCDEFIIVTNEAYKNIVNGQMKAFQSLKYRVILEGTAKGTAAAIMLGTMFANPTEFVLVVNSDNFIDGDGYSRGLSNKGWVLIKGKKAPICGRVCMDQFMVDVTDIPDVKIGDAVTLLGKDGDETITMEQLGELSGRFNYEFACLITPRVPRIYHKN